MQHRRRTLVGSLLAVAGLALAPMLGERVSAQVPCPFAPIFILFRNAIGPDAVGECTGAPSLTAGGDLTQPTTRGALVLRVADDLLPPAGVAAGAWRAG